MKQGLYKDFYDTDQLLREGTYKDDKKRRPLQRVQP